VVRCCQYQTSYSEFNQCHDVKNYEELGIGSRGSMYVFRGVLSVCWSTIRSIAMLR
jgi:hypothetical protein